MVHAEDDRAEVANPGLIARGVAGHVQGGARAVRPHHIRDQLVGHAAAQLRRDDVAREWIAHRNAVHQARVVGS